MSESSPIASRSAPGETLRNPVEVWLPVLLEAGRLLDGCEPGAAAGAAVARLCVEHRLADWCVAELTGPDGEADGGGVVEHLDPQKAAELRELRRLYPSATGPLREPGCAEFRSEFPGSRAPETAVDVEDRERLHGLGVTSAMTVPICARGVTLGTFTFLSSRREVVYGADDLAMAEELGRRTGAAVAATPAAQAVREEARINETLCRIGSRIAAELDLRRLVQLVTDEATALTGAQFGAFFYTVDKPGEEKYVLYTISGVPAEHFSSFPMPRNTKVFAPTFHGEGIVRSDDITQDPRYGQNAPYYGMPAGHLPVRSYLAVPVVSRQGEVIGGLFFGHAEPGVFTERSERAVAGVATQAAIAVDNARLLEHAQEAGARVTSILESITDAFYALDRSWRFSYVNRQAEVLLQRKRAELLGRNIWEEFPAALGTLFQEEFERAEREQQAREFTAYSPPPLDSWYELKVYPSRDGLSVYFRDVKARRTAEIALRRAEERYRSLVTATAQIVWDTGPTGEVEDMPEWRALTGQTVEEVRGFGWLDALHPEDRERIREVWKRACDTRTLYDVEYRIRTCDGSYRWFNVRGVPVLEADGTLREWVGTCSDIDHRKKAEEEVRRMNQELAAARDEALEASLAKSRFLASMSHELRTPLNAIVGYAELLEEEFRSLRDGGEAPADLDKIRNAGRHLLGLISGILDLSKIEAGKMELYPSDFSVGALVNQVVDTVRPLIEGNSNELRVICPEYPGRLWTDEVRLRQVLVNLMGNAGKFTTGGRVGLEVDREYREGQEWIRFRVTDTGIGMDAQDLGNLFREFTQLDSSRTRRHGGTGLGLAISRRFCRMMGGDITVESRRGAGSTFTVLLPVRLPMAPDGTESHASGTGQSSGIPESRE